MKTKIICIAALFLILAIGLFYLNTPDTLNILSRDFLEGLFMGIVSSAAAIWLIQLVRTVLKHKKMKSQNLMANRQFLLGVGMFSLMLCLLLNRFMHEGMIPAIGVIITTITSMIFMLKYLSRKTP